MIFLFILNLIASAESVEHKAHVHGSAKVGIAFEGAMGKLTFEAPGLGLFGFEHVAKKSKDLQKQKEMLKVLQNKIGEIGYWLADGLQGRGIITKCCTAVINHAFTQLGLNRIEIKCGTGNSKSRAVAEKLQFKPEGILRQAELLNGKHIDLYLYAMLKEEWKNIGGI